MVLGSVKRVLADQTQGSGVQVVQDLPDVDGLLFFSFLGKESPLVALGKRGLRGELRLVLFGFDAALPRLQASFEAACSGKQTA